MKTLNDDFSLIRSGSMISNVGIIGLGILSLIASHVLCWMQLFRVRKTAERAGMIPALIGALLVPAPVAFAFCIALPTIFAIPFQFGDWGIQQKFVVGIAFAVTAFAGFVFALFVSRKGVGLMQRFLKIAGHHEQP